MNTGDIFKQQFKIDTTIYQGFISLFKDTNPLHTQKDFAISKGFKAEVMFGNILNGFISYFIGECLPVKNVIIQKQEINFRKPVYLDDELFFFAEITEHFESVNTFEFKYSFKKQDDIIVANGKIYIGLI